MKKRVYIVSHSSMDLVSVLDLYEIHKGKDEVIIIVSSTRENLQFLQSLAIDQSVLKFVHFESRGNRNKKRLFQYLRQLRLEKKMLDELIAEISADPANELYFHSYDNDPHAGYLVAHVAATNKVTLVDVLGIKPTPLKAIRLLSYIGLKNVLDLAIVSFVFGKMFILSGTKSSPLLSLNLRRVKIAHEAKAPTALGIQLAKYQFHILSRGKNVVLLYADSYGVPEASHASVYRAAIECLATRDVIVHVKLHPQSRRPDIFGTYDFRYIPQFIPFEFVDLTNVSLVIGVAGASMLCSRDVTTVSLLKLLYPADSDLYASIVAQTRQNPAIVYVSSIHELDEMVAALA